MRKIINVIHQNEYSLESHEEFLSISKQIETPFSMSSLDFNSNSDGLKTRIYEDLVKSLKNSVRQLL